MRGGVCEGGGAGGVDGGDHGGNVREFDTEMRWAGLPVRVGGGGVRVWRGGSVGGGCVVL